MGVSKSTVVDAYERLVAEGAIASRRGSGFYVEGGTRPLSLQSLRPDLDRAIDPLWMTRQNLTCGPDVLKPGWGLLPDSYMPDEAVQRALRDIARDPDPAGRLRYASPLGLAPFREQISLHLAARGVEADPDHILLTDSASHGLDLVLRYFIEPGETVLVDDPCYFNFLALLLSHRARVVSVPFGAEGADVEALERVLAAERPRVYFTTAGPQNPTGATTSAATAHRVLSLAERYDTIVIEDDCFADFEMEPSPRLAAADGLRRVVQVGGFSKTVSSAMRNGFIVARPDWIEGMIDLKLSTCHSGSHLSAQMAHRVLSSGSYKRHVEALRGKLARDRALALARLRGCGLTPLLEPRAGLYLWAELPNGLDAAAVARVALEEDVLLAPGDVFSASRSSTGYLRFNAAACAEPRIFEVLARSIDRAAAA
jgi:DNA-binding transcriptional MocR family regulator